MSEHVSRNRFTGFLWLFLMMPFLAQAGIMDMFDSERVVARMADTELTDKALNEYLATLDASARVQLLKSEDALKQRVKDLTLQAYLTGLARRDGWDRQNKARALMERARGQVLFDAYMQYIGRPEAGYPNEKLVKTNYQLNREKYRLPDRIHVAQIFLKRKSDEKENRKLEQAIQDLAGKAKANGADFAKLARRYTQHAASKASGGDMGWVEEGKLLPGIAQAVHKAKVGDVIGPIQTSEGWHIIKLLGRSSGDYQPLAAVRGVLIQALRNKRSTEKQQAYLQEQVKSSPIKVDSRALRRLQDILKKGQAGSFKDQTVARMGIYEYKLSDAVIYLEILGPEKSAELADRLDALEQLVRQEMLRVFVIARARAAGWQKKAQMQARMDAAASKALYASYLRHLTVPDAGYPPAEEVKALYERKKPQLRVAERIRLAQIFLPVDDITREDQVKRELEALASQVRSGKGNFSLLAKRRSKHVQSANKGGDMGWMNVTRLLPEIRQAVAGVAKGELAGPVRGEGGWHLFRVLDRAPAGYRPFDEVKGLLTQALRRHRHLKIQERFLADLLKKYPVRVNAEELRKFHVGQGKGA